MDSVRNRRNYENEISQFSLSPAYIQKERKTKFLKLLSSRLYRKREKKKEFLLLAEILLRGYIQKKGEIMGRDQSYQPEKLGKRKNFLAELYRKRKRNLEKTFFYSIYRKSKYIRKASMPEEIQKASFSLYIEREKLP